MNDSQLTPSEEKFVVLQAQLAKIEHHLASLRERAVRIFTEPQGIQVTTYDHSPQPAMNPVEISFNLMQMQPGQFTAAAAQMEELVKEVKETAQRYGELSMALSDLRRKVQVSVTVEFPK